MFKNKTIIFILLWVVVCIVLGFIDKLNTPPNCMHQWAQADRASIARNYAEEDMNFFLPRVNNYTNKSGITGVEFPIVQYLAAICYQAFGFNEFWYRFIMLLIVSTGVFFAFKTALPFVGNKTWIAFCITLIWYCSPTLVFYTPNFIPDAASLGLCLSSWYFFFRYIKTEKWFYLLFIFIFLTLSSLIKITSLIGSVSMIAICTLSLIQTRIYNISRPASFKLATTVVLSMVITYQWYSYATWLNNTYGAEIFMLRLNPINNLSELSKDFDWVLRRWGSDYYSYFSLMTGIWLLLFCLFNYKTVNKLLLTLTLLYIVGSSAFMVLMMKQFLNHDYYIIALLPTSFFLLLTFVELFYRVHQNYIQVYRKQLMAALMVITASSFFYAQVTINTRYAHKAGEIINPEQLEGMEAYLRSIGISRTDRVVSLYDESPNISLYFLNVKGVTFNPRSIKDSTVVRSQSKDMDYLITNGNSVDLQYLRSTTKMGEKNGFTIYKFDKP